MKIFKITDLNILKYLWIAFSCKLHWIYENFSLENTNNYNILMFFLNLIVLNVNNVKYFMVMSLDCAAFSIIFIFEIWFF